MKSINCKINPVNGNLTLANPAARPEAGLIIQVVDVPESVNNYDVLRKAASVALWPLHFGALPVINWAAIAQAQAGALIRY